MIRDHSERRETVISSLVEPIRYDVKDRIL